ALLRDARQRVTYDRVLQLERQQFQLRLECHRLQSNLERQQHRLKRMRATAAVAAVGALLGGYGLFSPLSTTAIVSIPKDEHAPTTAPAVNMRGQTATNVKTIRPDNHAATVGVAAKKNENAATAIAATKADAAGGDIDAPRGPVETTVAQLKEPTDPPDRGE